MFTRERSATRPSEFQRASVMPPRPYGHLRFFVQFPRSGGDFHLRYSDIVGAGSDEPPLLEVNLISRYSSKALTGRYLIESLPQPDIHC